MLAASSPISLFHHSRYLRRCLCAAGRRGRYQLWHSPATVRRRIAQRTSRTVSPPPPQLPSHILTLSPLTSSVLDRWVSFTAGKAVISLPNSTQTATVYGGREGLILAADTKNVSTLGHRTTYPSNHTTVAIQIPLENNAIPLHSILHPGACVKYEENS